MRILISGVCGFVGSSLARAWAQAGSAYQLIGFDNLIRPGSEANREELRRIGVKLIHADARSATDMDALPPADWAIDAAANPSVLAGVDGRTSVRQLVEHNLLGTINLLDYCRRHRAGVVLLSTSRVYGMGPLSGLKLEVVDGAFRPLPGAQPAGLCATGITEDFSTSPPVSLYGATKLASEVLALEYGESLGMPVFVNRCGVMAGAGQFGRADQGIFAFWINSHVRRRPLKYMGFGGSGHQVRDCLHPRDLIPLLDKQLLAPSLSSGDRIVNLGGGVASATSLRQLNDWCDARFGPHPVASSAEHRRFDLPWIVLDTAKAGRLWNWRPQTAKEAILDEIAAHAREHPGWLELSEPL